MSKNRNGIRRIWPVMLTAIVLTLVMACLLLPISAFELTDDMLQDIQGFLEDQDSLHWDRKTLSAFAEEYLQDLSEKDPVNFSKEKLDELATYIEDENGDPDYTQLVDMMELGHDSRTINAMLDTLQKIETLDQLIDFARTHKDYANGAPAPVYQVEWKLGDVTISDTYRDMDVYNYPTAKDLGLASGEYVVWDTAPFFKAPANPDEVTVITGDVKDLASELAAIANGITQADKVFDAVVDEENHQVILALDVNPSNYKQIFIDLLDPANRGGLKHDLKGVLYDIASVGINAGVNTMSVNGHDILTVESYAISDLVHVLGEIADGHVGGLVSIDGIKAFIKDEDYGMDRFIDTIEYTVDGELYESFGDYAVKLQTNGLEDSDWTVSLAFHGDTSDIKQAAAWLADVVTVENDRNVTVDFTNDQLQFLLEKVYNSVRTPAEIKSLMTRFGDVENGYFFVLNPNIKVKELKALCVDDRFQVNQIPETAYLIAALVNRIPDKWDDYTLADFYDGHHLFAFDGTRDKAYFEVLAQNLFGDFSISVAGKDITGEEIIANIFKQIYVEEVSVTLDIYVGDYSLYYVQNGDTLEAVFMRKDMDVSVLFDKVPTKEGYDLVYLWNGEVITLTPDADVPAVNPLTYEYRVRYHDLTLEVILTDAGATTNYQKLLAVPFAQTITVQKTLTLPFGFVVDEAFILETIAELIPEGYRVTALPADFTMPDEALTLQVEAQRIYYTIQWMVDGELYAETTVPYGEVPAVIDPIKADDLNYTYEFKGWNPDVTAAYADAVYNAVFEKSSHYNEDIDDKVTIDKDDENINIEVKDPDGGEIPEIEIPLAPIIKEWLLDPTKGLYYTHEFGDDNSLELILTKEEVGFIIVQLDEILAEAGKSYDDVTLRVSFNEIVVDGKKVVTYEILFCVDGDPVSIIGNGGSFVTMITEAPSTSEHENLIYVQGQEVTFNSVENNGQATLEFVLPAFTEIRLAEEIKTYPITGDTTYEEGTVTIKPSDAAAGDTVTVTVTPEWGFVVDQVIVKDKDGNIVSVSPVSGDPNKFTFEQPSGGATVEVTFKKAQYTVTFVYIDVDGTETSVTLSVEHGSVVETPDIPTQWKNVEFTGTFLFWDCGEGMDYSDVTGITEKMTVTARYKQTKNNYTVTFVDWDGKIVAEYTKPYGTILPLPAGPYREQNAAYTYTFAGWANADGVLQVNTVRVAGDATYTATYTETPRYPDIPDNPDDPYDNPDEIIVDQKPGEDKVTIDATDKNEDNVVEIPMGPVLEEAEKNDALNVDITVNFEDGNYVNVEISAEEMQKIMEQLDAILDGTDKTYEDVEFVVTRTETTDAADNDVYIYDVTFRVDGEDVDLAGTPGENQITVTVPELEEGHEYVVEVFNPETGKFEELPEDMFEVTTDENGNTVVEITTPWYTEIKITEKILTFTVTFEYYDGYGNPCKTEKIYEYGQVILVPNAVAFFKTASHSYTFKGWDKVVEPVVKADAYYTANYDVETLYPPLPDDPTDPDDDPDDIIVNQNPGDNNVTVEATDKNEDGIVEIPMGPILDEAVENENLEVDITVNFEDDNYVNVEISAEEMQKILEQLDEILDGTDKTYEDVEFVVTREETTDENGNDVYVYDVTFRVDGDDVDLEGTPGENQITVTVPEVEEGHEYIVEVWDPTANNGEGGFVELPEDMYEMTTDENGNTVVEITTPWYTEIKVTEKLKTFTITFENWDGTVLDQFVYEYGSTIVYDKIPTRYTTIYYTYTFAGWSPAFVTVTEDATYRATYTPKANYDDENVTVDKNDNSLNITVNNGSNESKIPFGPVLSEIRNGLDVPLNYTHDFEDGYYLDVVFSETKEDHERLLTAIEAALAELGLPLDSDVSLYTARAVMTPEQVEELFGDRFEGYVVNAVYKYDISFMVGEVTLSIENLENNVHSVNVDYTPGSDSEFDVVTDNENEDLDSEFTEGGNKGGEVEFSTTHYSSFYVADLSKLYYVSIEDNEFADITVNPSEAVTDSFITVTVTPAEGYEIVRVWIVNGENVETDITGKNGFTITEDVTVKVEMKRIELTVTFVNYDGTSLKTQTVFYGENATPPVDIPLRPSTAQYTYTFAGWDSENYLNVKTNVTITAVYTDTVNKYTVTWIVDGNTTTEEYEYGQTPAFKGSTDKAADAQYTYTFKGWDKEIVAVTGPATYTAEYDSVVNKYTITFVDYNGTEIKKETLDYGAAIVAPADPTRAATLTTVYTFKGWTPEVAETVTADATYTATYTETLRNQNEDVTIEKNPEDGSIDVDADAKDPDGDGKEEVEIPMDGIYEEWENGFDKPINIIVNFGETFFLKVDILPEDQAEIYKTLKGLIEAQSLTSKDVKLVISREIVQLDGKTTTVYGLSFKVGNALVSMAGKGANTVTVNMPLTDGTTAEFDVYVMNTDGTYEKLESEMTDGAEGYANVTFSVPYYTSIRVMDMTVSAVTEMPTEEPSGCDGSNAWWIILLVVVLLVVLGLIGYILYQKGVFDKWLASDEAKETEAETEPETEETSNAAPLFIPLGEELPDDEPEEIHIVREVSVEEVDELMSDTTAEHVLEESERVGGVGRLGIINIGVLHDTFEEGDTVNLDILKDKDMIADSIGRLKVLASGSLDKALTVEADAFSVQAIKMITLTGGHAIKLRPADQSSQNQKNQKK